MPELPEVETVRRGLQPPIFKKKNWGGWGGEEKGFWGGVGDI